MTHDDAQAWLDTYVEAWRTYDPLRIGDLFTADAEYRYHPWDEPLRGREAILADWLAPGGDASDRDAEGTYDAHYEPWAVDADRVVAVGRSTYWTASDRATVRTVYDNVFLLVFDAGGRCRSFTELFIERPRIAPGR